MEKILLRIENRQLDALDYLVGMSNPPTDRSKLIRFILDDYFMRLETDGTI